MNTAAVVADNTLTAVAVVMPVGHTDYGADHVLKAMLLMRAN